MSRDKSPVTSLIVALASCELGQRIQQILCAAEAVPKREMRDLVRVAALLALRQQIDTTFRLELGRETRSVNHGTGTDLGALMRGEWNEPMLDALRIAAARNGWDLSCIDPEEPEA